MFLRPVLGRVLLNIQHECPERVQYECTRASQSRLKHEGNLVLHDFADE